MTQGQRTVNGVNLHPVLAYRWGLYILSADNRQAYESGRGEWTVSYTDPIRMTMSHVDVWWSLADALQGARAHKARLGDLDV